MVRLYGREWTRRELEARVGRVEQIGGVRRMRLAEGREDGIDVIRVRTGAGLAYDAVVSKSLDLSLAEFGGAPLSWQSPNGDAHPSYVSGVGTEWLRTASGGLLMTCGLTNAGAADTYGGKSYGLHGRAHHTPARHVAWEGVWVGDEYEMRVSGVVEETEIFGGCLQLRRSIRSALGANRVSIEDVVENVGFEPCPHMMLYHFNFGFPLLTEQTTIEFPGGAVAPREPDTPVEGHDRWRAPQAGFAERVYEHDTSGAAGAGGMAAVTLRQPAFPLASGVVLPVRATLRWDVASLPRLVQWYMPGEGNHVLGIEPANCGVMGIAAEAARGTLKWLEPGESVRYALELEVSVDVP